MAGVGTRKGLPALTPDEAIGAVRARASTARSACTCCGARAPAGRRKVGSSRPWRRWAATTRTSSAPSARCPDRLRLGLRSVPREVRSEQLVDLGWQWVVELATRDQERADPQRSVDLGGARYGGCDGVGGIQGVHAEVIECWSEKLRENWVRLPLCWERAAKPDSRPDRRDDRRSVASWVSRGSRTRSSRTRNGDEGWSSGWQRQRAESRL